MASARRDELIDSIFVDNQIVPGQLKEFLKIVSHQMTENALPFNLEYNEDAEEEVAQAKYLELLISQCEQRLAHLAVNPKSKIVIRNEGKKLDTLFQAVESLKYSDDCLQKQLDDLFEAQEKFRLMECEKKEHYQNMIDSLYTESLNSEICNLRRLYYGVKNVTDELVVKCNEMKKDIKSIQEQILILAKIPVLEKQVIMLLDWRASLREQFEMFVERYEHVKAVSITRCEVADLLKLKVDFCHLDKYVLKTAFGVAKGEFVSEFDQMKDLFCELQLHFNARLASLHKDVQRALAELASKRRLEKRGNKVKEALCN